MIDREKLRAAAKGQERHRTAEGSDKKRPPTQSEILLALAEHVELFHDDSTPYATFEVDGHKETRSLRSTAFKSYLKRRYYQETDGKAPSSQAVQDALGVLEGRALYDGKEHPVHVRLAGTNDRIFLDLGRADWSAVEITATGWRVVTDPAAKFVRPKGLKALPVPVRGGALSELNPFLNVAKAKDDHNAEASDLILVYSWLIGAIRPSGPYPVLAIYGEAGSAKTTLAEFLAGIIDPNTAKLRSAPADERDLAIAATNSWVVGYDNFSRITDGLSDSLCRLATGGGFGTRKLFTDDEEVIFSFQRPIVLTGIEEVVARGDLLDRCIVLSLPRLPPDSIIDEATLQANYERAHPRVLGAVLDAAVIGLRELPRTKLKAHPRMADFARWVTACTPALPFNGERFMAAYTANRQGALAASLAGDPVTEALLDIEVFDGTAADLLKFINGKVPESVRTSKAWPKSPRGMSGRLKRAAPAMRAVGYVVEFAEVGHENRRTITIRREADQKAQAFDRSHRSHRSQASQDVASDASGTASGRGNGDDNRSQTARSQNPIEPGPASGASGASGSEPTQSKSAKEGILV